MSKSNTKRQEEFTVLGKVVLDTVDGIETKRLRFNSPDHYRTMLQKIPLDKDVAVTISTNVTIRSRSQLAYFMVLATYIADFNGEKVGDTYPHLICDVWEPEETVCPWNGKKRQKRRSVSDVAKMPSHEMDMLIQHAKATCDFLQINVPTAEELGYISN